MGKPKWYKEWKKKQKEQRKKVGLKTGSPHKHLIYEQKMEEMNANPKYTKGLDFKPEKAEVEANVHAELYRQLKNGGVEVYSEYSIGRLRCDLVVVKDNKIKAAIEVKKKKRKVLYKGSRQFINYMNLNLPVIYCLGEENIKKTIETIESEYLEDEVPIKMIINN